jgi:hypothetical protein
MDNLLLIFAAGCFVVEALWHKNVVAAGLFFWVLTLIL